MKKLTRIEDLDIMENWKILILWTKIENENKNGKKCKIDKYCTKIHQIDESNKLRIKKKVESLMLY